MSRPDNRFAGDTALFDYLNPQNGVYSPLVELPLALNPYASQNIHIHAKLLNATPLGNVKTIPAFHMLDKAERNGKTKIIESSSGNTVASLAVLAPYFGFEETHAYVSHEITAGKLKMLRLFGVTPCVNKEPICPSESDSSSGIHKARAKGCEAKWYNPDQYANSHNVEAHYAVTGKQIWEQTQGKIDYFCAGLGTTGTFLGTARYLKERNPAVKTVGLVRAPNNPIPGPRTKNLLHDISFDWQEACDELFEIGTLKAYTQSLKMIRAGLIAGPSSGMNLAGVHDFIDKKIADESFQENREDIHIVFPCCDLPYPYMDDYFALLPENAFPAVQNKQLLQFGESVQTLTRPDIPEIKAQDLFKVMQEKKESDKILDIRSRERFDHYHIPDAINIPLDRFVSDIETLSDLYRENTLYMVCDFGGMSSKLCRYAVSRKLKAYSLQGGMTEWSEQDLPRVQNEACAQKYRYWNKDWDDYVHV